MLAPEIEEVPSPPALTAVFTGVGGRALRAEPSWKGKPGPQEGELGGSAGLVQGALRAGGTPDGRSKGELVTAERRRARAERSEAVDDAMIGHVEKMSKIIEQLVEDAGGEQYRCTCGVLGPKVPKLKLKEATEVAAILRRSVKQPDAATTVVPIQINVHAGGPLVPGQILTSGPNP